MGTIKLKQAIEALDKAEEILSELKKGFSSGISKKDMYDLYNSACKQLATAMKYSQQINDGKLGVLFGALFGGKSELTFKNKLAEVKGTVAVCGEKIRAMADCVTSNNPVIAEAFKKIKEIEDTVAKAKEKANEGLGDIANQLTAVAKAKLKELEGLPKSIGAYEKSETNHIDFFRTVGGEREKLYITDDEYALTMRLRNTQLLVTSTSGIVRSVNKTNRENKPLGERFIGLDQEFVQMMVDTVNGVKNIKEGIESKSMRDEEIAERFKELNVKSNNVLKYAYTLRHEEKTDVYFIVKSLMRIDSGVSGGVKFYVSEEENDFKSIADSSRKELVSITREARDRVSSKDAIKRSAEKNKMLQSISIQPLREIVIVFGLDSARRMLDIEDSLNLMASVGVNGDMEYIQEAVKNIYSSGRRKIGFRSLANEYIYVALCHKYPGEYHRRTQDDHVDKIAKSIYGE